MQKNKLVLFLLIVMLVSLACGVGGSDASREATVEAISAQVRATGTASAAQNSQPTPEVDTNPDNLTATAAAFAPILASLPKYGVDPSEGRIGWVHPPVSMDASGYHHFEYVNYYLGTLAQDFVISGDITWNTVGSTSGCGFVLRSNGQENALDQYVAIITRVASGHFLFSTMSDGEVVTGRDIYARTYDKSFRWENDTTNRLTIVGRGNRFWVYTNDTLIGEVDPSAPPVKPSLPPEPENPGKNADAGAKALYQQQKKENDAIIEQINADYAARQRAYNGAETVFDRGFMALVALSESGRSTTCKFDNTWLFLIGSP
jgi:outer membrane lipoprotein-sorting protein